MRGLLLMSLFLAVPVFAETPMSAEDRAQAAKKFYAGKELFDSGRYEEAAALWEEAYSLSKEPDLLWNLVNAYERAGSFELALERLQAYREFASESEFDKVRERVINLSERVTALRAERDQLEKERLEREAELQRERERVAELEQARQARNAKIKGLILPATTIGIGGAGVLTGAIFHQRAASLQRDLDALCTTTASGRLCPTTATPILKSRASRAAVAWSAYGVGTAAVATGIVLLITNRSAAAPDPSPTTAWVTPAPGGGLVGVRHAF
jgi:tetratricopeptide (TPR) repeat protein